MALYLTFILAGSLLFAFVCFYSIRSQRAKRAKMDQRLDNMVVDEMLKPSQKPSNMKQQSMDVNIAPSLTPNDVPTNKKLSKGSSKGNDVISVPIFDDDSVQDEDAFDVVEPNELVAESEKSTTAKAEHSTSLSTDMAAHKTESISRGSAIGPRSVPADEPLVENKIGIPAKRPTKHEPIIESLNNKPLHSEPGTDRIGLKTAEITNKDASKTLSSQEQAQSQVSLFEGSEDKVKTVAERTSIKKTSWDDRECELVARVLGENVISRDEILAIFRKYDFLLARKLHVFGFNTLTQIWSNVEREDISAVFTDLGISVQLADKSGALTRKELNTFSQLVLEYSETFNRQFSFSMDLDDAIEIGRELDELGRRHSSMVVLNIVPKRKDGFRSSDIDSCTRDLNMSQSKTGVFTRYRRVNNRSNTLYHVAVADEKGKFRPVIKQSPFRIHDIVIYLNVPTVKNPSEAFNNMADESRKLATWLDGKLVDKHHRNMTTKGISTLKNQVVEIEQNMQDDGITPGGALSHKLF